MYSFVKLVRLMFTAWLPFVMMAWLGKQLFPYPANPIANPNEVTFSDLRIFFSEVMPLLYVSATLMQVLFVDKLFCQFYNTGGQYRKRFIKIVSVIILVFSIMISILIWQNESGFVALFGSVYRLLAVQFTYWLFCYGSWLSVNKMSRKPYNSHISRLTSQI